MLIDFSLFMYIEALTELEQHTQLLQPLAGSEY